MALSSGMGMMQRELNCISNVIWETIIWIVVMPICMASCMTTGYDHAHHVF
jgi:hypothetical protein